MIPIASEMDGEEAICLIMLRTISLYRPMAARSSFLGRPSVMLFGMELVSQEIIGPCTAIFASIRWRMNR